MSNWNADRADAADRVIDRAVREIMSAEPRPGFRHRVLARLEEKPRPFSSWTWTHAAVAAVGALAIVFASVSRQTDRRAPQPQIVEGQPVSVPAQPAVQPRLTPEPRRQPAPPVAGNVARTRRIDRDSTRSEPRIVRAASLFPDMQPVESDVDRTVSEPFVVIDPIRIAPLSMTPLAPPQVLVRPLPALDRISSSPLPPPR